MESLHQVLEANSWLFTTGHQRRVVCSVDGSEPLVNLVYVEMLHRGVFVFEGDFRAPGGGGINGELKGRVWVFGPFGRVAVNAAADQSLCSWHVFVQIDVFADPERRHGFWWYRVEEEAGMKY